MSIKTIDAALRSLRAANVLSWQRGRKGVANVYEIHPPAVWQLRGRSDREGVGDRAQANQAARSARHGTVAICCVCGMQPCLETCPQQQVG